MSCRWKANLIAGLAMGGAVLLYRFAPETHSFYPRCPVWTLLNLYCPGCGMTRAAAALLHGRLSDAFRYNALAAVLLPLLVIYLGVAYGAVMRTGKPVWLRIPAPATACLIAAIAVFGVARNISLFR